MRRWLHPCGVALLALVLYGGIVAVYGHFRFQGNLTGFLFVDRRMAPLVRQVYPGEVLVQETGYDGQIFFLLAADPLARSPRAHALDLPAYRYGRILYPALCWLLSLGHPLLLPTVMLGVNLLAVAVGVGWAARWATEQSLRGSLGLAFAALPGVLIASLRDLPEALACVLLLAGFKALSQGRGRQAVAILALAVLTRETCVLPLALLGVQWIGAGRGRQALPLLLIPIPYLLWQTYVLATFGTFSFVSLETGLGPPLKGLYSKLVDSLAEATSPGPARLQGTLDFLLLAALLLGAAWAWRVAARRQGVAGEEAVVLSGLLAALLFTSSFVLEGYWSFLRVHVLLPLFCLVFLLRSRDSAWWPPLLVLEAGSLLVGGSFLLKRLFD